MKSLALLVCALATMAASACGTDTPENCLGGNGGGHGGPKPTCGPWADDVPEGGDVRIEIQRNGTDNTTTHAMHGYFFKDQIPARRELEGVEVVPGSGCTDVTSGAHFDNGAAGEAQAIADSRTYLEAGGEIQLKSTAQSFTLPEQMAMSDLSSGLTHDVVYLNPSTDGTADLRNHGYSVEWTGGGLGSMELTEPTAVQGIPVKSQLYVPANMENISPDFSAPLGVPATGDWAFSYTIAPPEADAPPLLAFAVFYNLDTFGVEYQCVADADGTMTIPRAMIDKLKPTGLVYFGAFTHVGHKQQGRRLDLVGVNCQYQEYAK